MKLKVNLFANLIEIIGEKGVYIDVEGSPCLEDVLLNFCSRYGEKCKEILFDRQGNLRESIIILVNDEVANRKDKDKVNLSEGDELFILLPVSGG